MPKIKTNNSVVTFKHDGKFVHMKDGDDVPRETWAAALKNNAIREMIDVGTIGVVDDDEGGPQTRSDPADQAKTDDAAFGKGFREG